MPDTRIFQDESSVVTADSLVVTPVSERIARLAETDGGHWTADDLMFYIREETARLCGPQLPCAQENYIANDFLSRFGADAAKIARAAYEIHGGRWMGAPVTIRRFSQSNDDFFARVILGKLG